MDYNNDELHAPDWVNAGFMKKVIESSGRGETVLIQNFKISPATAFGDHFASIMFRVQANFISKGKPDQKVSVIVKTFPVEEGLKKDVLESMNVFEAEIFMYTKVINECQHILRKCGYHELFAPELLYHCLKPYQVLVFDDLKLLGYYMIQEKFPNEHQIRLVFSKLAQYHAVTYKMIAEGRDDLNIKGTIFVLPFIKQADLYRSAPKLIAEMLDTVPGYDSYVKQLREIDYDCFLEKCQSIVAETPAYNVLNHGDYHLRNLMLKNNDYGAVSEVVLLDFQIPHFGSPAYDLVYMAVAMPYKHREMVFRHYFNVFSDVLVKSGFKAEMPTYEQLQQEIRRFAHVDLFMSMTLGLFMHIDMEELKTLGPDQFMNDTNARRRFYKSPSYRKQMQEIVPQLLAIINDEKHK